MTDLHPTVLDFRRTVTLYINGNSHTVVRGTTVLSALVASGYKRLRKSRKLEEARGPLCGMGVCYECLVTVNGMPNQRACMTEVENHMKVTVE
jgi:D-hydroxyproline dehydrogenase subunit gamma